MILSIGFFVIYGTYIMFVIYVEKTRKTKNEDISETHIEIPEEESKADELDEDDKSIHTDMN